MNRELKYCWINSFSFKLIICCLSGHKLFELRKLCLAFIAIFIWLLNKVLTYIKLNLAQFELLHLELEKEKFVDLWGFSSGIFLNSSFFSIIFPISLDRADPFSYSFELSLEKLMLIEGERWGDKLKIELPFFIIPERFDNEALGVLNTGSLNFLVLCSK